LQGFVPKSFFYFVIPVDAKIETLSLFAFVNSAISNGSGQPMSAKD
jgi:hypothetical protein